MFWQHYQHFLEIWKPCVSTRATSLATSYLSTHPVLPWLSSECENLRDHVSETPDVTSFRELAFMLDLKSRTIQYLRFTVHCKRGENDEGSTNRSNTHSDIIEQPDMSTVVQYTNTKGDLKYSKQNTCSSIVAAWHTMKISSFRFPILLVANQN